MKKFIGLFIVCLGWMTSAQAQNFEEEFNAFVNKSQQQFNNFVDSINKQFAEAMAANMKAFTGEQPMVRDPKPKPDKLPEIKKDDVPELPVVKPQLPPQESPDKPVEDKPSSLPAEQFNFFNFNLFGENIHLIKKPFPSGLKGITVDNVSDFWVQLSECDYEEMLQRCRIARQQQAFNDWAVYQLVLRMTQQTYDHQYNEQVVMTVFLLNQLGMEAKVGFAQTHLFCLIAVEQQLYGISFLIFSAPPPAFGCRANRLSWARRRRCAFPYGSERRKCGVQRKEICYLRSDIHRCASRHGDAGLQSHRPKCHPASIKGFFNSHMLIKSHTNLLVLSNFSAGIYVLSIHTITSICKQKAVNKWRLSYTHPHISYNKHGLKRFVL